MLPALVPGPATQMNEPRFFLNGSSDPCAKDPKPCTATLLVGRQLGWGQLGRQLGGKDSGNAEEAGI